MKIKNCPNCNSPRIAKILYGMPEVGDELDKALMEGKIVLGGCEILEDEPDHKCVVCDAFIFSKTGKYELNEE